MKSDKLKIIYFLLFFIIIYSSCQHHHGSEKKEISNKKKEISNNITVPAWFIEKPQISDLNLVYAYCSQYFNKKTEKKMLLSNAAENIKKSKNVAIKIIQKGKHQTDKYLSNTQIQESKVRIDEKELENKYTIIHQYPIGSGILALAAETKQLKNKNINVKKQMKKLNNTVPPKWVKKLPFQNGFVFGVGSAQDHSSPEKAWKVAEKNARANIALQLHTNLLYEKNEVQTSMWEWLAINHQICSSMILTNAEIIKHGYCESTRTYYALARMKIIH